MSEMFSKTQECLCPASTDCGHHPQIKKSWNRLSLTHSCAQFHRLNLNSIWPDRAFKKHALRGSRTPSCCNEFTPLHTVHRTNCLLQEQLGVRTWVENTTDKEHTLGLGRLGLNLSSVPWGRNSWAIFPKASCFICKIPGNGAICSEHYLASLLMLLRTPREKNSSHQTHRLITVSGHEQEQGTTSDLRHEQERDHQWSQADTPVV